MIAVRLARRAHDHIVRAILRPTRILEAEAFMREWARTPLCAHAGETPCSWEIQGSTAPYCPQHARQGDRR